MYEKVEYWDDTGETAAVLRIRTPDTVHDKALWVDRVLGRIGMMAHFDAHVVIAWAKPNAGAHDAALQGPERRQGPNGAGHRRVQG